MASKLYAIPTNNRSAKVLISAKFSGSKVELAKDFVFGETNKTPAFVKKFPLGKVPALQTKDGDALFESNAVAYYVANEQLRGKSALEQAQVMQWMFFADNELVPAASAWVFPTLGIINSNKQAIDRAKEEVKKLLNVLNDYLLTRTYLVGERISLADIVVSCALLPLYQHVLEPALREPYTNVNRWFVTLMHQPQFAAVLGDVKLCEKAADGKKGGDTQVKEGKKQDKKEKKEPKQQPKKSEAELEDEGDEVERPKPKDPLAELPKGTWVMDDFKRFYSNNDVDQSIPYFWEKFDKENYSIWFCEYKYANELTQIFMSCNLISGMFQRLDTLRKNAFASVCLFGEDHKSSISGVWVWRGHELAFKLSPDWQVDYESYDWKKLDADAESTKKLVKDYFTWDDNWVENGKKFNQGKIFK